MMSYAPNNPDQMWCPVPHEDRIVNAANQDQVIDIKGEKDKNGAKIVGYEWHGGQNQMWSFQHV